MCVLTVRHNKYAENRGCRKWTWILGKRKQKQKRFDRLKGILIQKRKNNMAEFRMAFPQWYHATTQHELSETFLTFLHSLTHKYVNKLHLLRRTQGRFISIQNVLLRVCCKYRPVPRLSSGMSVQISYEGVWIKLRFSKGILVHSHYFLMILKQNRKYKIKRIRPNNLKNVHIKIFTNFTSFLCCSKCSYYNSSMICALYLVLCGTFYEYSFFKFCWKLWATTQRDGFHKDHKYGFHIRGVGDLI